MSIGLQIPGDIHRITTNLSVFIHIDVDMSSISINSRVMLRFDVSAAYSDLAAAAAHTPCPVHLNIYEPLDIYQRIGKGLYTSRINKKTGSIVFFRSVMYSINSAAHPYTVLPGIVIVNNHAEVISRDKPGSRSNGTAVIIILIAGQIQESRGIDGDCPGIHGPYIRAGHLRHSLYPAEVVHFQIMSVEIQGEVMLSVMLPLVDDRRRGQHIAWIRGPSLTAEKGINRGIYFKIIGNSITGDTTFHIGFIFVQVSC